MHGVFNSISFIFRKSKLIKSNAEKAHVPAFYSQSRLTSPLRFEICFFVKATFLLVAFFNLCSRI